MLFLRVVSGIAQNAPTDLVIPITAQVNASQVKLQWIPNGFVSGYRVLRKPRSSTTFIVIANNLPNNAITYTDHTAVPGAVYEYCVQSTTNNMISGYVTVGDHIAPVHFQGEILLVVDNTYKEAAEGELLVFKQDLIKEGWKVNTVYVSRTQSAASIKSIIAAKYNANPSLFKGCILLGHIPVPYSGNIAPDAHQNHIGAWPSDIYYADVLAVASSVWNDNFVQNTAAADIRNHNIIGDGKFDISSTSTQQQIPIFVGRVDVYNMPLINTNDVMLFKQYLTKNHVYRSGLKQFRNKALIQDNFGYFSGEAFAQNGWRNFSNLFGSSEVETGSYFTTLKNNTYLWSYACGGGTYTSAQGVGNTASFQANDLESVFTMLYGSYFGDWDNQNNFLRAPIASPSSTLVSIWGGRPNWFLHSMNMGEPIGYSYISSVNNSDTYFPRGLYAGQVHQSMQGDPTLKMYMFKAPKNLTLSATPDFKRFQLTWTASSDPEVSGYFIYKANSENDAFVLLNPTPTTNTSFDDILSTSATTIPVYMVRSVKLQQTTTGSFYNLSPGILSSENMNVALPLELVSFNGTTLSNQTNELQWVVNEDPNLINYTLERSDNGIEFTELVTIERTSEDELSFQQAYRWIDAEPLSRSYYRLRLNLSQGIRYSQTIGLVLPEALHIADAYPSPFTHAFNVPIWTENSTEATLAVYDLMGRIVGSKHVPLQTGNNLVTFEGSQLTPGTYLVVVHDAEHKNRFQFQIQKY